MFNLNDDNRRRIVQMAVGTTDTNKTKQKSTSSVKNHSKDASSKHSKLHLNLAHLRESEQAKSRPHSPRLTTSMDKHFVHHINPANPFNHIPPPAEHLEKFEAKVKRASQHTQSKKSASIH
jgi:hypothetical protein